MYFLKIMRTGQPSKFVPIDKFISIPAENGVKYQIVDSTGQMAEKVINFGRSGSSLIASTPNGTVVQIEDYFAPGMTADMQYPEEFLGSPSASAPEEFMSAAEASPGVEASSLAEAADAAGAAAATTEGGALAAAEAALGSTGVELAAGAAAFGAAGVALSTASKSPASAAPTAPATPTISSVTPDNAINSLEKLGGVVITGTADPSATVTLSLSPGYNVTTTADGQGNWRYSLTTADYAAMGEGAISITAYATNASGLKSGVVTHPLTIDTVAPVVAIDPLQPATGTNNINAADLANYQANGLTLTGTTDAEVGQQVSVLFNGTTYTGTVATGGTWSVVIPAAAFTGLPDGAINATVNVADLAGNHASPAVATFTVDTVPPVIAITGAQIGANATNDLLLNASDIGVLQGGATPLIINGTTDAEVGQTVTVTVDYTPIGGVLQTYTTTVVTPGSWSVTIPPADAQTLGAAATLPVTVAVSDATGNAATPLASSIVVDTVPPVISIDPNPTLDDGYISAADAALPITVSGTTDALGRTVTLTASDGVNTVTATAVADGVTGAWSLSFNPATLNDGSITISVATTDLAGNQGTANHTVVIKDTAPPAIPTIAITPGVDPFTAAELAAGNITVTAEAGSSVAVTLTGPAGSVTLPSFIASGTADPVIVANPADLATIGDGVVTVSAVATDQAGNASSPMAAPLPSFTLDTVAPAAPTIAVVTGADFATAAEAMAGPVTVTGAAGDTISVTFSNGTNTVVKTITATGGPDAVVLTGADLATLTDGTINVVAQSIDAAGNTSPISPVATFVLDTVIAVPTVSLATDSGIAGDMITNSGVLNISALAPGDTRQYVIDGAPAVNTYDAMALSQGAHTVQVIDTDQAGNTASASISFTLDNIAPTMSFPGGVIPATLSGGNTVTVTTNEPATVYLVNNAAGTYLSTTAIEALPANQWTKVTATGTGATYNATLSASGLVPGNYDYYVVDTAGNISGPAAGSTAIVKSVTVTVDLTAGTIVSSDGSTNFVANVDYTIDIIVPANGSALTPPAAPWSGGANLGAGDVIHIVGPGNTSGELQYVKGATTGTTAYKATAAVLSATPNTWSIVAPKTTGLAGTGATMIAQIKNTGVLSRRTHAVNPTPTWATGTATLWTGAATFGNSPTAGAQLIFV